MEALKEHTIAFSGLADGAHEFKFNLDPEFYTATGDEDLNGGQVTVDVKLEKSNTLLVADMHLKGTLALHCDRCDGPLDFPIDGKQQQIYRLTGEDDFEDDELVSLDSRAHSINLTHYIYECLRLALPIRHVHPTGQCDPEVEQVLNKLEVDHDPHPDPRWEVLKDLKDKQQ